MLNINQNFDLKAPVFNFDRDYFNSLEELKAYDTSNVPNHFVTNVAGMLYQFTDGNWLPMIGTDYDADTQIQTFKIANDNCVVQLMPSQSLYQYAAITPYSAACLNSHAQVNLYSQTEDMPPQLQITLTDKINYSKSILCGQGKSAFGLTIEDLSNHSASMFIDEDSPNGESPVGITLIDNEFSAKINAKDGFVHKTDDGYFSLCNSSGFDIHNTDRNKHTSLRDCVLNFQKDNNQLISLQSSDINSENSLIFGSDKKFKISRPVDNTEGATITGVKSIVSFANPSATKVWATDGSTVNMPTKFSDLKNDSISITGNKGETDAKFKIYYNQDNIVRSKLEYKPRNANVGIPELALASYDTSGHNLSQLRIRPDDNRDNGQYLIQVQNVIGDKINYVSTLATENVSLQNFKNNTSVDLKSDELDFYGDPQGEQIQLKINKEGITKTNGKPTEVFATDGSTVDLSTYTNYFNGTTTADKLKAKAVDVIDNTNSVTVSPTGINISQKIDGMNMPSFELIASQDGGFMNLGDTSQIKWQHNEGIALSDIKSITSSDDASATKVFVTDGSIADLNDYAKLNGANFTGYVRLAGGFDCAKLGTYGGKYLLSAIQADQSPTKVYTTDGNLADLSTKANASDVLLKKSASGGYYIEATGNGLDEVELGEKAFAANNECTASGRYSFAEGYDTTASGEMSHAEGNDTTASGLYTHSEGHSTAARGHYSHAEGKGTYADGSCSHAEGGGTVSSGDYSHAEGYLTEASGLHSHAEGCDINASGNSAHAEGLGTIASGVSAHAQGLYNIDNKNAIHSTGIGNSTIRKNAEYIYAKTDEDTASLVDNPKNGYKYLIGVGGYDGINTDNSTYKSVQEVIADLTARIEQLEKLQNQKTL